MKGKHEASLLPERQSNKKVPSSGKKKNPRAVGSERGHGPKKSAVLDFG